MEKKTKLTITGSAKKSIKNIEIAKTQGKNSVVIEKQTGKFSNREGSFRSSTNKQRTSSTFNRGAPLKPSFNPKSPSVINDFERTKAKTTVNALTIMDNLGLTLPKPTKQMIDKMVDATGRDLSLIHI